MTYSEFERLVVNRFKICARTLTEKAKQYAISDDRLIQFKVAAVLENRTPEQALQGMMIKHTIALNDFINNPQLNIPREQWEEKIVDSINYLVLLEALVKEKYNE